MSSLLHTRSGTPLTCGEPSKFDLHKSLAAFDAPVDSEVDRLDTTPTLPNTSNLESAHARTALNTTDQVNGVVEDIREVVPALWGSEHASGMFTPVMLSVANQLTNECSPSFRDGISTKRLRQTSTSCSRPPTCASRKHRGAVGIDLARRAPIASKCALSSGRSVFVVPTNAQVGVPAPAS